MKQLAKTMTHKVAAAACRAALFGMLGLAMAGAQREAAQ
jgi:hypothetical protein